MNGSDQFASHREVILFLDGPSALARRLGLEPANTTVKWSRRGIPSRYWHVIADFAAERGKALKPHDLARMVADNEEAA